VHIGHSLGSREARELVSQDSSVPLAPFDLDPTACDAWARDSALGLRRQSCGVGTVFGPGVSHEFSSPYCC
jgi:hypothetical protein